MKSFLKVIYALSVVIVISVIGYDYLIRELKFVFINLSYSNSRSIVLAKLFILPILTGLILAISHQLAPSYSLKNILHLQFLKWKHVVKWILILVVYLGIYTFLAWGSLPKYIFHEDRSIQTLVFYFMATCLLVPFFEEITCRGFLFKALEIAKMDLFWVVIIVTFVFAFAHGPNGLFLLPVSFIYTYARYKTNSTALSILLHFLNNFIVFIIQIYLLFNTQV